MNQQVGFNVSEELQKLEGTFSKQNAFDLKFENECLFARQQILKSDFALSTAQNNQGSLKSAILNVAAIGISLNPALAHAYLVPRDRAICLDVSYRGLVKLATDSGAITSAAVVLIYTGDTFKYRGPYKEPKFESDVLDPDRINLKDETEGFRGGYCVAQLGDGGVMVSYMTADEILKVRGKSKAFTNQSAGRRGPWEEWFGEMAKKTILKRASKSWPQSGGRERLDHAIEVINQHEGIQEAEAVDPEAISRYRQLLATGTPEDFYLFETSLSEVQKTACFNSAPQGEKTRFKQEARDKIAAAIEQRDKYIGLMLPMLNTEDPAILELTEELTANERTMVMEKLTELDKERLALIERNVLEMSA